MNLFLLSILNVLENLNLKFLILGLIYDSCGKFSIIVRFNLLVVKFSVKCNIFLSFLCLGFKNEKLCLDVKSELSDSDMDIDDDIVDFKDFIECFKFIFLYYNNMIVLFLFYYLFFIMNGDIISGKRKLDLDFFENDKKCVKSEKKISKWNSLGNFRE